MSNHRLALNTIIALTFALGSLQGQDNQSLRPPLILEAKDASVKGPALFYNSVVRRLVDWQNLTDVASFETAELPPGEYSLKLVYTAGPNGGGRLRLNWNSEILTGAIRQTDGWAKADEITLGKVKHAGGNVTISLQAARIDRTFLMDFVSLNIIQVSATKSPALPPSPARLTPSPQPTPQPQSNGKPSPPRQEVRLKAQVAMPIMVNGKASGSMTLPAGTFVALLETTEAQSKIRWKDMESWVASSALELPESPPSSSPERDTDSSSQVTANSPDSPHAVAEWDFSKAEKADSVLTIPNRPDSQGGKLTGKNASWAEIVGNHATSQRPAVRFLGAPDQRLLSSRELELLEGQNFRIEMEINPSDANDSNRRLIRLANCFELRLLPEKSRIEFIIWRSHQNHASVKAEVAFNTWNKVVAEYRGDALELTVNGESARKTLPTDMKMQAGAALLSVAYASEGRSFVGSIGRIRWSSEPGAKPIANASAESESTTTPAENEEPSVPSRAAPSNRSDGASAVDSIPLTISGSEVQVLRRGHGPLGVLVFGHSGSQEMVETLLRDEKWFGDLLPDQCSFFLWSYPKTPPFDKVGETISAYRGGDYSVRLPLRGIAESVVSQIRKATGIERFLIVGNSLGAGIVLWDYEKLVGDPSLSFLLISPTEAFLPEVSSIPSLERTMLLAAKGWMNNDGPMRTDSFLRGEVAWDWVAQYRDDEAGDLISDSKSSSTSSNSPREFDMGHKVIGGDINAELLGKLIRVNLGLSPKEILADPPKQTE